MLSKVATSANKLQPRSVECVFLGYAPQTKGYRCFDPKSGRVYISSHVRFHENTFPYPKLKNLAPLSQPIFDISDIFKLTSTTQQLSSVPAPEPSTLCASSRLLFLSIRRRTCLFIDDSTQIRMKVGSMSRPGV